MASDAHLHPYYLFLQDQHCEAERAALNIQCAASSFSRDEFLYNEKLAKQNQFPRMALCFAVHPQLPVHNKELQNSGKEPHNIEALLLFLEELVRDKRLPAIGETGFDLFDAPYKESEKHQEAIFEEHLGLALKFNLPVVLHIRRAMHKVFCGSKKLRRLPAVVFHAYSGSLDEAQSILRRGINAYFSFGAAIALNHKNAMQCCAGLEAARLLLETDAPYQPFRGKAYSAYRDILLVMQKAAALRSAAVHSIEEIIDNNFIKVFGGKAGE